MRRLLERERAQRRELERAYVETVETLTTALESRDTDTASTRSASGSTPSF